MTLILVAPLCFLLRLEPVAIATAEPVAGSSPPQEVIFLQLDRPTAAVFEQWPPGALDYAVLATHLAACEPAVVILCDVLRWPELQAPSARILANRLRELPLALAAVLDADPLEPISPEVLEHFYALASDSAAQPASFPLFKGAATLPPRSLWRAGDIGFTYIDFGARIRVTDDDVLAVPLVARTESNDAVAALPLLGWIEANRWDAGEVTILWEDAFVLRGPDGSRIPLDAEGNVYFPAGLRDRLKRLSAMELLPESIEATSENVLPPGAIVVIGNDEPDRRPLTLSDDSTLSLGEAVALAILAMATEQYAPRVKETEPLGDDALGDDSQIAAGDPPGNEETPELPENAAPPKQRATPVPDVSGAEGDRYSYVEKWPWLLGIAIASLWMLARRFRRERGGPTPPADRR